MFNWFKKKPKPEAPSGDIESLMHDMNENAFRIAETFEISLDYSDESVKNVESMLSRFHSEYERTKDDSGLRGIAIGFAAYLGEVIRRKNLGGTWSRNHSVMGDNSFPFNWKGADLFLYGWCMKRIFDGEADNIWTKYQCCVLDVLKES